MTIKEYCYALITRASFVPDTQNIIEQYMTIFGRDSIVEVEDDFKYYLKDQENARNWTTTS